MGEAAVGGTWVMPPLCDCGLQREEVRRSARKEEGAGIDFPEEEDDDGFTAAARVLVAPRESVHRSFMKEIMRASLDTTTSWEGVDWLPSSSEDRDDRSSSAVWAGRMDRRR